MTTNSNDPQNVNNIGIEKAKLLWDEYKYRHELCWRLIFQITVAVVAVSIIPYTKVDIAKVLTYWIVALPALGIALTIFSRFRMTKELDLLDKIRKRHRQLQEEMQSIDHEEGDSTFSRDVKSYLGALVFINAVDIVALVFVWIPRLK